MKYIRTKDKIMVIPEDKKHLRFLNDFKQADTIEELYDEFVFVGQENVPILMETLQQCLDRIKDLGLTNHKIYGAIWTDKGLIYVAKMKGVLPNSEIDWELL